MRSNLPIGAPSGLGRMAYALSPQVSRLRLMRDTLPLLPESTETIAELRELYRAAEARGARLRLLYATGRDLAEATPDTIEAVLQRCAERLAFFVGCRGGGISLGAEGEGIAIPAPGNADKVLASIVIDGLAAMVDIADQDDRDTFAMQVSMIGATIDRLNREGEKADLLEALQDREKRLEFLLERIFTAQEEERRRVSHELHDGVAQTATALVRLLEQSEVQRVGDGISHSDVARSLVSELRRVIAGLRPTLLDDLGLVPALRALADGLEAEGYEVTARLHSEGVRLPPLVENALYRVAQEAITNVLKHAGGPCRVEIEAMPDSGAQEFVLRVRDFGKGPTPKGHSASAGHNLGIEVMRERMTAIGGSLEWSGKESAGVLVEARLPRTI